VRGRDGWHGLGRHGTCGLRERAACVDGLVGYVEDAVDTNGGQRAAHRPRHVADGHAAAQAADPVVGRQQRAYPGGVDEVQLPQVEHDRRPSVALDLAEELFKSRSSRDIEFAFQLDRQRPRLRATGPGRELSECRVRERGVSRLGRPHDWGRAAR